MNNFKDLTEQDKFELIRLILINNEISKIDDKGRTENHEFLLLCKFEFNGEMYRRFLVKDEIQYEIRVIPTTINDCKIKVINKETGKIFSKKLVWKKIIKTWEDNKLVNIGLAILEGFEYLNIDLSKEIKRMEEEIKHFGRY